MKILYFGRFQKHMVSSRNLDHYAVAHGDFSIKYSSLIPSNFFQIIFHQNEKVSFNFDYLQISSFSHAGNQGYFEIEWGTR